MRALRLFSVLTLSALTILSGSQAKAGLLLEPYLGYELGKISDPATSTSANLSTAALGARVAFAFPVVFVGLDYSTMLGGSYTDSGSSGNKLDAKGSDLFVEVGAQLPLIRAFVGYGLMHDTTASGTLAGVPFSNKFDGGNSFKLGIGTTILPAVAVNFEYLNETYSKLNGNSMSQNETANFYMLDISLPFNL